MLHSANYWFGFNGYNEAYGNRGNCLLLITLDTIRSPMRLRNVTPAALYLFIYAIRYADIIYYIVFGDGSLINFNLAKLCNFTTRTVFDYIRAGAHCISKHDILRGDFWKLFTSKISEKFNILDKIFYSDWLNQFF